MLGCVVAFAVGVASWSAGSVEGVYLNQSASGGKPQVARSGDAPDVVTVAALGLAILLGAAAGSRSILQYRVTRRP